MNEIKIILSEIKSEMKYKYMENKMENEKHFHKNVFFSITNN